MSVGLCLYIVSAQLTFVMLSFVSCLCFFIRVSDEVNVSAGWQLEGRRLIPVLPRLIAQSCNSSTAFLAAKLSDPVKMQMQFEERYGLYKNVLSDLTLIH